MNEDFEGDVLLTDNLDGGEISIINGLVMPDRSFTTAVFLSLFGGNSNDQGKIDNKNTWWGNKFSDVDDNERMVSKFQAVIGGFPLTSKNIKLAEQAAVEDLAWMIKEGIADDIYSEIVIEKGYRINLEVVIKKSGELIEKGKWAIQWGVEHGV